MYHVRLAGGRVSSELQLRSRLSPTEYLEARTQTGRIETRYSPLLGQSRYFGPILGSDDHQQIPEGGVGGKHRSLSTDLAPVSARRGLAEVAQVDGLVVTESSLQKGRITEVIAEICLTSRLIPGT